VAVDAIDDKRRLEVRQHLAEAAGLQGRAQVAWIRL
jgi:hypothetical protein